MVSLKTPEEIALMAEGGRRLAAITSQIAAAAIEGAKLKNLDALAFRLIKEADAEPAFLSYQPYAASKPFPATICASLNNVIVHGLPTNYALRNGDLLKIDLGLKYHGWYVDTATTVVVGQASPEIQKLVDATKKALMAGIKQAQVGLRLGDIGYAIQKYARTRGFDVADGLTGHGVGRELHEDPCVWNVGRPKTGLILQEGLVIAIEPMIVAGSSRLIHLPDDSYATEDGSWSAHFEHTVAITKNGPRILT